MAMTESGKFEIYKKKLQGICDEHNLVYRFKKDAYPIMLIIQTAGGVEEQMSMLEEAEEDGYRSPDAQLRFSYKDGDLVYRISETFTIGDALFNKIKNLFKNMHFLWLQFYHREITVNNILSANDMPFIEDDGDDYIADEAFDDLGDDTALPGISDDDESEDAGEEGDGYEYDEPANAEGESAVDDEA